MQRVVSALVGCAVGLLATAAVAQDYSWKPDRPVTIIVPWAAGGSTDQVTRVTAAEIEKALGQKVIVVNQPGASGSIGTKNALEALDRLQLDLGDRGHGRGLPSPPLWGVGRTARAQRLDEGMAAPTVSP